MILANRFKFAALLRFENSLNGGEQLRRIQRFLQESCRALSEAFGFGVGTSKRSQHDDRQRGENFMDGVNYRYACQNWHP